MGAIRPVRGGGGVLWRCEAVEGSSGENALGWPILSLTGGRHPGRIRTRAAALKAVSWVSCR